jgi:hypothetical protein
MKAITVFVLSMAVATSSFAYSHSTPKSEKSAHKQAKLADKKEDKKEKAALKAECKKHPNSAACKQDKRAFKAEERAENHKAKHAKKN